METPQNFSRKPTDLTIDVKKQVLSHRVDSHRAKLIVVYIYFQVSKREQ